MGDDRDDDRDDDADGEAEDRAVADEIPEIRLHGRQLDLGGEIHDQDVVERAADDEA